MTIEAKIELAHRTICVRQLLCAHYTQAELEQYCALYKITTEQFRQCQTMAKRKKLYGFKHPIGTTYTPSLRR